MAKRGGSNKIPFTVKAIEGLVPPAAGRLYVYDARTPSLAICVTANGTRTFYLYRRVGNKPQRTRLGRWPQMGIEQARAAAMRTHVAINEGADPNQAKRDARRQLTLGEAFDDYLAKWVNPRGRPRTETTERSRFRTCWETWRERKLGAIRREEVIARHTEIGTERGKVTANRAVQLLRRVYNHAAKALCLEVSNPAQGIELFAESERERFLQADELPLFFAAVQAEENDVLRDFFLLALWTGARSSNVRSMRWDDLNLDARTWTIPATEFKTCRPLMIPLAEQAVAILREREKSRISDWVMPGVGKTGHLVEPKGAWERIRRRSGLRDLRIHDLRRTLGSWQAAGGSSLQVIGKSLGHSRPETTQIYARLNLDAVRDSVNAATAAISKAAKGRRKG